MTFIAAFAYTAAVFGLTGLETAASQSFGFNVNFSRQLPSDPVAAARAFLEYWGCAPDGLRCLQELPETLRNYASPALVIITAFVLSYTTLLALTVGARPIVDGVRSTSVRHFGSSVSTPTAVVVGLGLPALVLLGLWAGGTDSLGQVVEKDISSQTSTIVLLVFSFALLVAGWAPVYERNAPLIRLWLPFWRLLPELPFRIAFAVISVVATVLARVVNVLDHILVQWVAVAVGASLGRKGTVPGLLTRYSALLFVLFGLATLIAIAPGPIWLLASAISGVVVLSLIRRWSWVEEDRVRSLETGVDEVSSEHRIRIGFNQDLRDEAMTALAIGVGVITPLVLMRADASHIFAVSEDVLWSPSLLLGTLSAEIAYFVSSELVEKFSAWFAFTGGELIKALPFVDWSEVYPVRNGAPFSPRTTESMHIVFALRATMDLLLLAAFVQAVGIATRLASQRAEFDDPGSPRRRLDVFVERSFFAIAGSHHASAQKFALYEQDRLRRILRSPLSPLVADGAAYVAGFQFADEALRDLATNSRTTKGPWTAAAEGLAARAIELRNTAKRFHVIGVRFTVAAGGTQRYQLSADARRILDEEGFEPLVSKLRGGTPRADRLNDLFAEVRKRRSIWEVAGRLSSKNEARSDRAYSELQTIATRDTTEALIELLGAQHRPTRAAVCEALGIARDVRAVPALVEVCKRASSTRFVPNALKQFFEAPELDSAVRSLGRLGDSNAVPAIAGILSSGSADVRVAAANALGEIGSVEAAEALGGRLKKRARRVKALGWFSPQWLSDYDWWATSRCAEAIGWIASPEAEKHILDVLESGRDWATSDDLLKALSFSSSPLAVAGRLAILNADTKFPDFCREITWSLAESGGLVQHDVLENICRNAYSVGPRIHAAWSLARLGCTAAVPTITQQCEIASSEAYHLAFEMILAVLDPSTAEKADIEYLKNHIVENLSTRRFLGDLSPQLLRSLGAWVLGHLGGRGDARPIAAAISREYDSSTLTIYASALGNLRSDEGLDPLLEMIGRRRPPPIRRAAYRALGRIGGPKAIEAIANALESDGNALVRAMAAMSIADADGDSAAQRLVSRLAAEQESKVRDAICVVLAGIDGSGRHAASDATIAAWAMSPMTWQRETAAWTISRGKFTLEASVVDTLRLDGNEQIRRQFALGPSGSVLTLG